VVSFECLRRKPLAVASLAILGISAVQSYANTLPVTSCTDNGVSDTGNLRNTINGASSGDTIDMTSLTTCPSGITLSLGEIVIHQDILSMSGPGASQLQLFGSSDRVLYHQGSGTPGIAPSLTISGLTMEFGYTNDSSSPPRNGGCINSVGDVALNNVHVYGCRASSNSKQLVSGGAIYTIGSLTLDHSTLKYNHAQGTYSPSAAVGGGALAAHGAKISYSTIANNGVTAVRDIGTNTGGSVAGGIAITGGSASVRNSTISFNSSGTAGGGIVFFGNSAAPTTVYATIINSTISNNKAVGGAVGGAYIGYTTAARIYNTTIAYNTAASSRIVVGTSTRTVAAGLGVASAAVDLESTLIAENSFASSQYDWSMDSQSTVIGHNNLIHATESLVPTGTLTGAAGCPLLGPLRDNGGPTWTHALMSSSQGTDAGNQFGLDPFTGVPPTVDQRGLSFDRVSGFQIDIGAYEVQQNDIIFNSGFQGCAL
jgi:hypothetical protein